MCLLYTFDFKTQGVFLKVNSTYSPNRQPSVSSNLQIVNKKAPIKGLKLLLVLVHSLANGLHWVLPNYRAMYHTQQHVELH
jgi:hypothetical protein